MASAALPLATGCLAERVPSEPRAQTQREPMRGAPSPNARPRLVTGRDTTDGQGATLKRVFPWVAGDHLDPFVLLDDFAVTPPAGFPLHPHRGFEAFTYMLDGGFIHHDNLGNDSTVHTGGVQVFTSGRGAWHSEMPGEPRPNRGLQLWVNLPRSLKPMDPRYAAADGRDIPESHRRGVTRRDVVGGGSPVRLETPVRYLDLRIERAKEHLDALDLGWQGVAYVIEGNARIGDIEVPRGTAAKVLSGELSIRALDVDARVALIVGRPHHEPIVHHGPFVD